MNGVRLILLIFAFKLLGLVSTVLSGKKGAVVVTVFSGKDIVQGIAAWWYVVMRRRCRVFFLGTWWGGASVGKLRAGQTVR